MFYQVGIVVESARSGAETLTPTMRAHIPSYNRQTVAPAASSSAGT